MVETVWQGTLRGLQERFKDRPEWGEAVVAMTWCCSRIWDDFKEVNLEFRGMSVKCRQSGILLVVKATENDVAVVCFIQALTLSDAFRILYRQWLAGALYWVPDKFA